MWSDAASEREREKKRGHRNGRATKSELHMPPRKIQFAVTLTCSLAECHRVASDTRRYDTLHRGGFNRLCSGRSTVLLSLPPPSLPPPALTLRLPLRVTVVAGTPRRLRASTISTVLSRCLYRVVLSRAHVYRRIHGHGRRLVRQGGRQQFLTKKPESPSPPSPSLSPSLSLSLSFSFFLCAACLPAHPGASDCDRHRSAASRRRLAPGVARGEGTKRKRDRDGTGWRKKRRKR